MAERGVIVSYEAVRLWCLKFGQTFAKKLRQRRGRPGDTWHLDELFIRIRGERYYLWRAVDQDGQVLDILVQKRRNTGAAKRFFRKLLKGLQYVPNRLVTDKLRSYGAAYRVSMPSVHHCTMQYANNRAEVSHQPTRQPANANATCVVSNLYDTYSGFCPSTVPSTISFGLDGT